MPKAPTATHKAEAAAHAGLAAMHSAALARVNAAAMALQNIDPALGDQYLKAREDATSPFTMTDLAIAAEAALAERQAQHGANLAEIKAEAAEADPAAVVDEMHDLIETAQATAASAEPAPAKVAQKPLGKRAAERAEIEARLAEGVLPDRPHASGTNAAYEKRYEVAEALAKAGKVAEIEAMLAATTGKNTYARKLRVYLADCLTALASHPLAQAA